jgi:Regulator of RNA terminal phosphate cyclase
MVVGETSFSDVVSTLAKMETKLGREVNPTVYGPREFREKLAAKNHFLSAVAKEKKLFVIAICRQPDFEVKRLELLHGLRDKSLAQLLVKDIAAVSPETAVASTKSNLATLGTLSGSTRHFSNLLAPILSIRMRKII